MRGNLLKKNGNDLIARPRPIRSGFPQFFRNHLIGRQSRGGRFRFSAGRFLQAGPGRGKLPLADAQKAPARQAAGYLGWIDGGPRVFDQ